VALAAGIHHLTFLTSDLDRLIAFYERVFDTRVTFDRTEEDGPVRRHAFIEGCGASASTIRTAAGTRSCG
jgi:catechol 2,3-dioxygenase-like lactoylglutathione lyase family enzyme